MEELDKMLISTPCHHEYKDAPKVEDVDLQNDNDGSVPNLEIQVNGETCESLSKIPLSNTTSNEISRSEDYEDANETLSMQPIIENGHENPISSIRDESSQVVVALEDLEDDVSLPDSPPSIKKKFLGTSPSFNSERKSHGRLIPHFRQSFSSYEFKSVFMSPLPILI
jgi:hypothetical protein